jgi:hypothetical protein
LRIDIDGDPEAPPRRGCAALSSAPKALGNREGLPGQLLLFRFEFLQRLGAAHTHFLLMSFKTPNKPAAAGLNAFAQPLYVAHTIGADVLQFSLGLGGNQEQARRN